MSWISFFMSIAWIGVFSYYMVIWAEIIGATLKIPTVVMGLVFLLVPEWLLGVFSDDRAIVAAGVPCLAVAAVAAPIMGGAVVLSQALRGAGDTRTALGATFLGGLVVRLSATWGFAFGLELGLVGVWLGSTLDWAVRLVLLGVAFRRGRWRTLEV